MMRVLIADDQRSFGLALADMVRYCGHEVVAIVGSGLEAINAYTLYKPDLVLMDYRMPKLNGGTACRHILAKDAEARVILVSGWSPSDGADASGAISFLPKPVDLNRLNAVLENVAQSLPPPTPVENTLPGIIYPQDSIDYFQPVAEPIPVVAVSPELSFAIETPQDPVQPESVDYFQPIAEPLPVEPLSSESDFPIVTPQIHLEPIDYFPRIEESLPVAPPAQEKKSRKRRAAPRRGH